MTRSAVQSYEQISSTTAGFGHGRKIKRSSSAVSSRTIVIESRPLMLLTRPLTTVGPAHYRSSLPQICEVKEQDPASGTCGYLTGQTDLTQCTTVNFVLLETAELPYQPTLAYRLPT
jgi:hypothetical protein